MQNTRKIYFNLFLISAIVICYEIISTRISSVIYVNNYAFIILSMAILGLGSGGIFAYLRSKSNEIENIQSHFSNLLLILSLSLFLFLIVISKFHAINPFLYFFLSFVPFFLTGIFYSEIFKIYADSGFTIYAIDLSGAAAGSILAIALINISGGINSIIILIALILLAVFIFKANKIKKIILIPSYLVLLGVIITLLVMGNKNVIGQIPVGFYPEKDIYHTYDDPRVSKRIVESRWSVHGRTDLVEYSQQDFIKYIFIDGAAGSPMYRFKGNPQKLNKILFNLLIQFSTSIPFTLLNDKQKNSMLVIGPGGGREVLLGILTAVDKITGVEVNPDFVDIVKENRSFNGGIYTDFPNVNILVQEGRHYIKKTQNKYDLIVMALPSTEQLQNIDNFAMNENFLLTVEALDDYLKILTQDGQLIFTLHNNWELIRIITSSLMAFKRHGIEYKDVLNHIIIIDEDNFPTIIIKKKKYTKQEVFLIKDSVSKFPKEYPQITYLPYQNNKIPKTRVNNLLSGLYSGRINLNDYIKNDQYDISPCYDNSPYFYKVNRGVPNDFKWLIYSILLINLLILTLPFSAIKKTENNKNKQIILLSLLIFSCIGIGFMIIEISLFQKLILYLGSPTVSLSILLCSLLMGMGIGSYYSNKILTKNEIKKINLSIMAILIYGIFIYLLLPFILNLLLQFGIIYRIIICIISLIPLGFFLGIPFPTSIKILAKYDLDKYIPWMYGINGTMTVLGSVLAVIISMVYGFTQAFYMGLGFYLLIIIYLSMNKRMPN